MSTSALVRCLHPRFASRHRRDKIACPRLSAPTCFAEQESSPLTRRCAAGVDVTKPKTLAQASPLSPSLQTPSSRNQVSRSFLSQTPAAVTRLSRPSRCPPPPAAAKGGFPPRPAHERRHGYRPGHRLGCRASIPTDSKRPFPSCPPPTPHHQFRPDPTTSCTCAGQAVEGAGAIILATGAFFTSLQVRERRGRGAGEGAVRGWMDGGREW